MPFEPCIEYIENCKTPERAIEVAECLVIQEGLLSNGINFLYRGSFTVQAFFREEYPRSWLPDGCHHRLRRI